MSEKQIIKQLKCLVAKQQAQIHTLLKQLAQMKINSNERYEYYGYQDRAKSKSSTIKYCDYQQDQYSQTFDDNMVQDHHNGMIENQLINQLESQMRNFYQWAQLELKHSFLHHQLTIEKQPLFTNFNILPAFAKFISDLKDSFLSMKNQILKLNQQQISLSKKIISQQKTLNEIVTEYQNNIKKSQIIERKLLKNIQALQHNQAITKANHQYHQSSQNKSHKYNYSP